MIKFGVEIMTKDDDKITMYKSEERAYSAAKSAAENKDDGDIVVFFSAECDDKTGMLATNEFNILETW